VHNASSDWGCPILNDGRARREKPMLQRSVVMTAAWLEIVGGATFLTVPGVASRLLFAA